jgi:broad specificity phosphatase PhoE
VVLVRHASAEGQGRFLGQRDAPLSALGRRQLPALVKKLRRYSVDAIYCSDLSRTRATAAAIARRRVKGAINGSRPSGGRSRSEPGSNT